MTFTHYIRGFSNYVIGKNGYVIRLSYITINKHYKQPRFISYSKSDNRLTLYSDKGKKERLSKQAIKKRGFVKLHDPLFIPMKCELLNCPF